MLSGGTQRHALLLHQSEAMKILNIEFPRDGIEPTTCHVYHHTLLYLIYKYILKSATTSINAEHNFYEL